MCFLGIESFAKIGDSIYFEQGGKVPGLYIIQYVSSTYDWKAGQVLLNQNVDPVVSWDPILQMTLSFTSIKVDKRFMMVHLYIIFGFFFKAIKEQSVDKRFMMLNLIYAGGRRIIFHKFADTILGKSKWC